MFNLMQYRRAQSQIPSYGVAYTGQLWEWRGEDDFRSGRYKAQGQGGKVLAINIPTKEMAERVRAEMERKIQEPLNWAETGIVLNVIDSSEWRRKHFQYVYPFSRIQVMTIPDLLSKFGLEDLSEIKPFDYAHSRLFVDYQGVDDEPISDSEIGTKEKEVLELLE